MPILTCDNGLRGAVLLQINLLQYFTAVLCELNDLIQHTKFNFRPRLRSLHTIEVLQIIMVRHTCTFCIEPTGRSETEFVTSGREVIYTLVFLKTLFAASESVKVSQ